MIPQKLQHPDFRFILIKSNSKTPSEVQWQVKNNYPFNHQVMTGHNGNFGIVCGYGNLIVLDIDDIKYIDEFDKKLNTFSIKTGSGKRHYYFSCGEKFEKHYYILGNKAGELRISKSQVVIPPSIHPNGNKYEVFNDVSIKDISKTELKELLGELLKEVKFTDTSRSGIEWREVCTMIEAGYNFDEVDSEMRLLNCTKWNESDLRYKLTTYCNALKSVKENVPKYL